MTAPLHGLSSMATRALLAELAAAWDGAVTFVSVGGLEAARRVRDGAAADVVVLAEAPLRALAAEGFLRADSVRPIVRSAMAAAVRDGAPAPDLGSVAAFREALGRAGRIGYSTGPSGDHLLRLLDVWNLRHLPLVQAPAGVPVGQLLADGAVDLAIQQRSELIGIAGVSVVGDLPAGAGAETVFAAGVTTASAQGNEAARFLAFLAAGHGDIKRRHGMRPMEEDP